MLVTERPQKISQQWLKRKDAAIRYGVSVVTIDKWLNEEGLASSKVGGAVLINARDIEDFVRARARPSPKRKEEGL